jgi:osmotically-inducible protein OsmY
VVVAAHARGGEPFRLCRRQQAERARHFQAGFVVDAVDGVVTLRGQVPAASMKDELERKARDVTGVRDVQNLLHLPGEDAPMLDTSAAGRSAR